MPPKIRKEEGMVIEKQKRKREVSKTISKNSIRRIANSIGLKRISNDIYEEVPKVLEKYIEVIIRELLLNLENKN
jgi:histone H3/H4